MNSPNPTSSVHDNIIAMVRGSTRLAMAANVPHACRLSSVELNWKWIPAEYAKLKQLNSIKVSSSSFIIRREKAYMQGQQSWQRQLKATKRKATSMIETVTQIITLQLRRKFEE